MQMITVHTVDFGNFSVEFDSDYTVDQVVQKIRDDHNLEMIGNYSLRDGMNGRVLAESEIVPDHRRYYLTAWLKKKKVV
jgi:hypothetical protein